MGLSETVNDYFDIQEHGSSIRTEILAGVTTFLTMSYIVIVNPLWRYMQIDHLHRRQGLD